MQLSGRKSAAGCIRWQNTIFSIFIKIIGNQRAEEFVGGHMLRRQQRGRNSCRETAHYLFVLLELQIQHQQQRERALYFVAQETRASEKASTLVKYAVGEQRNSLSQTLCSDFRLIGKNLIQSSRRL